MVTKKITFFILNFNPSFEKLYFHSSNIAECADMIDTNINDDTRPINRSTKNNDVMYSMFGEYHIKITCQV